MFDSKIKPILDEQDRLWEAFSKLEDSMMDMKKDLEELKGKRCQGVTWQ